MAIYSAVILTAKALSLSARSTRAAKAWIHAGRSRAATAPQSRGVLQLCLRLLLLPGTLLVLVVSRRQLLPSRALEKTSMSSHRLNERGRRPCRTGGNGVIFAGSLGGAEEEARGAGEEDGGASSSMAPQISRASQIGRASC